VVILGLPADRRRFVIGVIASRLSVCAGPQAVRQAATGVVPMHDPGKVARLQQ
jgi:hypothetical protein